MRRVIVYKGMTDIVKEVFMKDSTIPNYVIASTVTTMYPNCEFEIDEFDYGNIDVSKTAKELDASLKKLLVGLIRMDLLESSLHIIRIKQNLL